MSKVCKQTGSNELATKRSSSAPLIPLAPMWSVPKDFSKDFPKASTFLNSIAPRISPVPRAKSATRYDTNSAEQKLKQHLLNDELMGGGTAKPVPPSNEEDNFEAAINCSDDCCAPWTTARRSKTQKWKNKDEKLAKRMENATIFNDQPNFLKKEIENEEIKVNQQVLCQPKDNNEEYDEEFYKNYLPPFGWQKMQEEQEHDAITNTSPPSPTSTSTSDLISLNLKPVDPTVAPPLPDRPSSGLNGGRRAHTPVGR